MLNYHKNDPFINIQIVKTMTHPSTYEYKPIVEGISTNHKYSNRIELSGSVINLFNFYWFDVTPPINLQSIHPSTQPPIHPPIAGGVFTNHKSSNLTEISELCQDLFNF